MQATDKKISKMKFVSDVALIHMGHTFSSRKYTLAKSLFGTWTAVFPRSLCGNYCFRLMDQ